ASGTVGAIMCAAMSVDMLQDVAVQAQEAGIVVVYLGAEPTAYQISSCVYTAYEITGMWAIDMAEAWAKQNSNVKKDDKGVPIAIDTYDDIVDGRYRSNAFRDEAEASDILYVYNESTSYGNDAQNTAYNWAENMMTANPDLRIFICYEPDAMKGVTSYLAQYAKDNKLDLADFCVINCYEDSETPALLEQAKNDPSSTAFKGYVTYGASPIDTGKKLAEEFLGIVDGSWPYGQSYYDEINAYSSFGFSQHWEMGQENPALKYKY
ncbi:MAG: substrate-binding domain-containing protein, partial [Oscillospiraceae bacterium]